MATKNLYRVLFGHHYENDDNGKEVHYKAGDPPFESSLDLLSHNGPQGMTPKFELIQRLAPPGTPPQPYVPEQRELSDEELMELVRKRGLLNESKQETLPIPNQPTPVTPPTVPVDPIRYPSLGGKPAPQSKADFVKMVQAGSVKDLQSLIEDAELDVDTKVVKTKDELVAAIVRSFE